MSIGVNQADFRFIPILKCCTFVILLLHFLHSADNQRFSKIQQDFNLRKK
jgi:hypothetical protein